MGRSERTEATYRIELAEIETRHCAIEPQRQDLGIAGSLVLSFDVSHVELDSSTETAAFKIPFDPFLRRASKIHNPLAEHDHAARELHDRVHVMTDKQNRTPMAGHVFHFSETFLLKFRIPDRQHFIHDQNLRLEMRGDREGETHIHAAAVALDRCIEELLHLGKGDDLVEFLLRSRRRSFRGWRR